MLPFDRRTSFFHIHSVTRVLYPKAFWARSITRSHFLVYISHFYVDVVRHS